MDRNSLARATEPTDAPTPGYLYIDIAKNTASSPVVCAEIANYLTNRLANKNSPNVKYKCLKVISKTAVNPVTRGQFKRQLAQDSTAMAAIKEAMQFRGPPDPARGDEPYVKVRTAAKEAIDAIYSDTPTSTTMEPPHHYSAAAGAGAPSSAAAGSRGGFTTHPNQLHQPPPASGTGRRMEGIGNPRYKDPRAGESGGLDIGTMTIGDIAKEAGATLANMIKDPLAKSAEVPRYGNSNSYGPPGRNQLTHATGGQWTMASNRGPGSSGGYGGPSTGYGGPPSSFGGQSGGQFGSTPSGGVGGSWGSVETAVPISSVASQARVSSNSQIGAITSNTTGSGGTAVSDGAYEKNMILELCPPGGMKAEPPPDKLARFAQAVPSLNADLICPALLDCLEEGNPWVIRAKALCVIETCITVAEHFTPGDNAYAAFFYACRGEIEPLTSHARLPIQQPAQRILSLLGVSVGTAAVYPASVRAQPAAPAQLAAPAADLLDFGAEPEAPPPPPSTAPSQPPLQPPATPTTESGLFGGLNLMDAPKTPGGTLLDMISAPNSIATSFPNSDSLMNISGMPSTDSGGGLFGDLSLHCPPAPSAGTTTSGVGLFGDMVVKSPPAPPPSEPSGSGLFGDMVVKSTPAPAPSSVGGGLFDDVVVMGASTVSAEVANFGTMGGSAFGFMNSSATPADTPVFDPLLSMASPNTAKKMMATLGPEQLNAMYTQQNVLLMQQQMQMQQMQMMMQQQQQQQKMVGGPALMMQPQRGSNRNVMGSNANFAASSGFSFLDHPGQQQAKKKEDSSFDFVKDAMKNEKK